MSRLNNNFLSLCGAERLALCDYPLQAYTIHRNTFDNVVLSSAALQKITDFYSIEGIDPKLPLDVTKVKQNRKNTEWAVRGVMLGKNSGLSKETIDELLKLDDTYDLEVHGSRLSFAGDMGWIKGKEPLSVVPKFVLTDFALHMNRFVEVAWMVHRLIPAIQPPEAPLSEEWQTKWSVLDDAFKFSISAITAECDKKFGAAVVEFVENKFSFNAKTCFPL